MATAMKAMKAMKFRGRGRARNTTVDWPLVFKSLKPGMFIATHSGVPNSYLPRVCNVAIGASAATGRKFVGCIDSNGNVGVRED